MPLLGDGIGFGPVRGLLEAQEPPFWSLVLIFRSENSNFGTFSGVLGVRLDWEMYPDIYLSPMDHFQPLLGFVFIIFNNLTIYPLFPSMDFRGPWGCPKEVFDPLFSSGDLITIGLSHPIFDLAQNVHIWLIKKGGCLTPPP